LESKIRRFWTVLQKTGARRTSCCACHRSFHRVWARRDSNPRPYRLKCYIFSHLQHDRMLRSRCLSLRNPYIDFQKDIQLVLLFPSHFVLKFCFFPSHTRVICISISTVLLLTGFTDRLKITFFKVSDIKRRFIFPFRTADTFTHIVSNV
jgi:hypothetical protein